MTSAQVTTDALTSIFSFITGLRAANPGLPGIAALVTGEKINGTDDFGTGETNDGDGNTGAQNGVLPVYGDIKLNDPPIVVCSRSLFGNTDSNKLGNRVFLRFDNNAQRLVTITATASNSGGGVPATDPDMFVLRRGALAAFGAGRGSSETIDQILLQQATYIIEVFDFDVDGAFPTPRCMTVSVTG
jgi:hypothetical protein